MTNRVDREDLLKRIGIDDGDFRDYLKKSVQFIDSLDREQRKFHLDHLPTRTIEQVAESLGPDVTEDDVRLLFAEAPPVEGVMFVMCCHKYRKHPNEPLKPPIKPPTKPDAS